MLYKQYIKDLNNILLIIGWASVCGSASSIKGFKEDKVCVVIPLGKIIEKMGE